MIHALHVIYSMPFLAGLTVGVGGYWLYNWQQCRWLDKHHPNKDGTKHQLGGINTNYAAAAVVLAIIGYILLSTTDTHDETVSLARDVARCQVDFNNALIARSAITTQDTDLANQQSDLRVKIDVARHQFLDEIQNPPPNVDALPLTDLVRHQYMMDAVREYATWTDRLSAQINDIVERRKAIQADRLSHPLPVSDCGKPKG